MDSVLDDLDILIGTIAGTDLHTLDTQALMGSTLRLCKQLDQLKVAHALMITAVDQTGAWRATGARSVADWLAGKTNSDARDVRRRQKLGDTLDKHQQLADDVASGSTSTAAADAIADVLDKAPADADTAELFDKVRGAGPVEARKRAEE